MMGWWGNGVVAVNTNIRDIKRSKTVVNKR
jgi:hypothetical protein